MPRAQLSRSPLRFSLLFSACAIGAACGPEVSDSVDEDRDVISELSTDQKMPRYARIREIAARRGIHRNAFLLAGIANDETGLAQCWSEATWACPGPHSPECGGPVIAGAADGACSAQQGGLGIFQFDSGTYRDTLNRYGDAVLTVDGQVDRAIDYVIDMVWRGVYTPTATDPERALAWINELDIRDADTRDRWIKTVVRHYNGCQPNWSCWNARYRTYSEGLQLAIDEPGGFNFWGAVTPPAPVEVAPAPRWKVLDTEYQVQETGYWCGPAATRVALSARMNGAPSQAALAQELGTTRNGTDWIGQITSVLNRRLGATRYVTVEMPNDPPTQAQRDRLWRDLVLSIDNNYPLVANIVAPPSNHPPGYPNSTIYHYFTVIGYNPDTREVYIADSANFGGNQLYWLSFDQLATLIPPKGYSTYACPSGLTIGAIDAKYRALGGCSSVVGGAVTAELGTPDGIGRYNVFERGSIYWTPNTGAFEVHGRIREVWGELGWENGALGYPVSDEYSVAGGRRSDFQNGAIVWTAATGETRVVSR